MTCHSQLFRGAPVLAPLYAAYAGEAPQQWNRVHDLPDFVYFDHSAHVTKGVGCETCHGRVDQMAQVYQAAPLTMQWCVSCHRDPAPHLRPDSAITTMGWHAGEAEPALSRRLAATYRVRSLTNCTTCHR
jgi:hypothetical protein